MEAGKVNVAVIGGGLVGTLEACFLAKRGFKVDLYEYRDDIRKMENVSGKSINLALSLRGRSALHAVGLEHEVLSGRGVPMYGRMIHGTNGSQRSMRYGKKNQAIYSVSRRLLNELLLTCAEKYSNVNFHFQHKLVRANLTEGIGTFSHDGKEVNVKADLLVGCDGAHSVIRREMIKQPGFNFSQEYIEHGYMELYIPPTEDGQCAMEVNYLHIWPRGSFMMIALPNQDKSWTVTLFMPIEKFKSLKTSEKLLEFFDQNFPDAIPLIGELNLIRDFFSKKPSYLVSIKCFPYNVGKSIIMGDAAHAMVPFYGQGMNAGFEDCLILDELLEECNNDFSLALAKFSSFRNPDAEAICDLAMYNYVEMRELVNSPFFLMRKKLDNLLHSFFPKSWIPLYTMVTFSRTRYHEVVNNKQKQDKILKYTGIVAAAFLSSATAAGVVSTYIRDWCAGLNFKISH